jgi:hypothetical protein
MEAGYPEWPGTVMWIQDYHKSIDFSEQAYANPFSQKMFDFEDVMRRSEKLVDNFGKFQDLECKALKNDLLVHEHRGSGRIRLQDFYGFALGGDWRFSETVDYLRQLGALDMSDPNSEPSVIIPNYVYGKSMCSAASSYYAVCCIDECYALLGRLEGQFAASDVEPSRLAVAVSRLPSLTVPAPRNLSSGLVERLHRIAAQHNGLVPIHGRQFSLFLHHAYPRECPFPHASGTTRPRTQEEWVDEIGEDYLADNDTINRLGRELPTRPTDFLDESDGYDLNEKFQWDEHEELLTPRQSMPRRGNLGFYQLVASLAVVGAISSVLAGLYQTVGSARSVMHDDAKTAKKHLV